MKYMLILQFPESAFLYDEIEVFEDSLIDELSGVGEVDGHDIGVGELNFFILTNDAKLAFKKIENLLKGEVKTNLRAAYRDVDGDEYVSIYPPGFKGFSIS